jgi:hypothetical protein
VIDALVIAILVLVAAVVGLWILGPRVRASAERPKHQMLERIARFETQLPRRAVVDPHRESK